ncbi:hypothetical protein MIND_00917200 [Mycena indigotica]|uniref:Uncharacterized protein n=1 Tax=Mycena indigotica TaxID=2126181 RepID=A0A8H6W2D7_9AGAR|nr:uncharacterized protein MIND_00917200 [Mycena indigotica]KAF7296859.1 hypothetical protein MIND_00917200 [Mycena indigotica]
MPPLVRYPTPSAASIHSWWSDSNPSGATINLHSVARPLIHALYSREARKLTTSPPYLQQFTTEVAEQYLGFLACDVKIVGVSAKVIILRSIQVHLGSALTFDGDSALLCHLFADPTYAEIWCELLTSPHIQIHLLGCSILRRLSTEYAGGVNYLSRPFVLQTAVTLCGLLTSPVPDSLFHATAHSTLAALCITPVGTDVVVEALESNPAIDTRDFLVRVIKLLLGSVTFIRLCMSISSRAGWLIEPGNLKLKVPWSSVDPQEMVVCADAALRHTLALSKDREADLTLLRQAPAILQGPEDFMQQREFFCWFTGELALMRGHDGGASGSGPIPTDELIKCLNAAIEEAEPATRLPAAAGFALEELQVYNWARYHPRAVPV